MVSTSLKAPGREWIFPPEFVPSPAVWRNYIDAWGSAPVMLFLRNSVLVTSLATAGGVLTASVVAFAFARMRYFGRDFWFMLLISTMMLPGVVTLIPLFILYRHLLWLDTLLPLTVPSWLGGGAFNIFLIRQFYRTLPLELDEAARVDGASTLRIYWQIIVPLAKPVLAVVAIFGFIHHWNDFMGPLIFTNSLEMRTLAVGLHLLRSQFFTPWNLLMAGSVWMVTPVLVLYFLANRYFVQGIVLTGLSGR